jgi:uncharacterized peroxidase-related enzyme
MRKRIRGDEWMAHINLPAGAPGIIGPMTAFPETEVYLNGLAQVLLRGESSLTSAERELIATHVSNGNKCFFCTQAHAATARELYGSDAQIVDLILSGAEIKPVSEKMQALLMIVDKVRLDGRLVAEMDVERARAAGADDKAIHDTVLIAAAFCMFNRYVDGLGTWAPQEPAIYQRIGEMLASNGYTNSIQRE